MKIQVTKQDMRKKYPVETAIQRTILESTGKKYGIDRLGTVVTFDQNEVVNAKLPIAIQRKMDSIQRGEKVRPFGFELKLPYSIEKAQEKVNNSQKTIITTTGNSVTWVVSAPDCRVCGYTGDLLRFRSDGTVGSYYSTGYVKNGTYYPEKKENGHYMLMACPNCLTVKFEKEMR